MGIGTCTSKSVLVVLGTIFTLSAISLWTLSGYVMVSYRHFEHFADQKLTLIPAVAAIAVGIVLFLAGLLGCCGTENRCTLTLFASFLLLVLALLVGGVVVSQVYKAEIIGNVRNATHQTLSKYAKDNSTETQTLDQNVDWVQENLRCCGLNNYTDWAQLPWAKKEDNKHFVPGSCYAGTGKRPDRVSLHNTTEIFPHGCIDLISDVFSGKLQWVFGALLGFAILLVLGIVSSCVLCCLRRQEQVPYFSLN